jgi:hypothetical protein
MWSAAAADEPIIFNMTEPIIKIIGGGFPG